MIREWGCPKCKEPRSSIDDTAWDEDGYCVRLRRCVTCLTYWPTEELPLSDPSAFYGRAHSRKVAQLAAHHRRTRRCCFCGVVYNYGSYSRHIRSDEHYAALSPVSKQRRANLRRAARDWYRRKVAS